MGLTSCLVKTANMEQEVETVLSQPLANVEPFPKT